MMAHTQTCILFNLFFCLFKNTRSRLLLVGFSLLGALTGCDRQPDSANAHTQTDQHVTQAETKQSAPTYYGIDISRYEGRIIDQLTLEDSDLKFIICKVTEGETLFDSEFTYNWAQIKQRGFIRGAYHFFYFRDDVQKQLAQLTRHLTSLEVDDMPPIVDVEDASLNDYEEQDTAKLHAKLLAFMKGVEAHYQRKPILYVNYAFANEHLDNPEFSQYPLWVADYRGDQVNEPMIPNPWKAVGWKIWQRSEHHGVKLNLPSGTTEDLSDLDYDEYRGPLEDLVKS